MRAGLLGLAAILLAVAEAELILVTHGGPPFRDALLLAGLTVPIAWRRQAPLGVAVAVMSVLVLGSVGADPLLGVVQSPIFPVLIVTYTVASYSPSARAWVGLAVCVAGPELAALLAAGGVGAAEISLVLPVACWVAGRAARAYRDRAHDASVAFRHHKSDKRPSQPGDFLQCVHNLHALLHSKVCSDNDGYDLNAATRPHLDLRHAELCSGQYPALGHSGLRSTRRPCFPYLCHLVVVWLQEIVGSDGRLPPLQSGAWRHGK